MGQSRHFSLNADQIYQAAKIKNPVMLKKLLGQGIFIDERYQNSLFTPAGKLASEGNKRAVSFLIQFGANVDDIALGAAISGQRDYAEDLRINYQANANAIAQGAAYGGYFDYTEYLRINHHVPVGHIAAGAAWGGHFDYAEYLRVKYRANLNDLVLGATYGGHRDYAEILRTDHHASLDLIAWGAAWAGQRDYAEYLRLEEHADVNLIASNAAQGGHYDYAEYLRLQEGTDVNQIALGAAKGRHRDYAEYLRTEHGAEVNSIAFGAAKGAYHNYAEDLYLHHGADIDEIAKGLSSRYDFISARLALRELTKISDDLYRQQLVNALTKQKNVCENINTLPFQAKKLRQLQDKYDLNYYQAVIWLKHKDIRTWTFYGDKLQLPQHIFEKVMTYLAPHVSDLNAMKIYGNKNKLLTNLNKQSLHNQLTTFTKKWFTKHQKQAINLLNQLEQTRTDEDVNKLLSCQFTFFGKPGFMQKIFHKQNNDAKSLNKNEYHQIIKRHYRSN